MNALEFAREIVNSLEDKKGEDIVLIDLKEVVSFTDYFIICSGTSDRMINALADAIVDDMKANHDKKGKKQGFARDGWVIVDYGDTVVHLFSPDQRSFYNLEELWEDGKVLLRVQ